MWALDGPLAGVLVAKREYEKSHQLLNNFPSVDQGNKNAHVITPVKQQWS